jgi:hypothetical protein
MEEGISLFSSLLSNKHFLIVFVHALEQQKDFAVRDRSGCRAGEGLVTDAEAQARCVYVALLPGQWASLMALHSQMQPGLPAHHRAAR